MMIIDKQTTITTLLEVPEGLIFNSARKRLIQHREFHENTTSHKKIAFL